MLLTNENINEVKQWLSIAKDEGATILIDKEKGWTSFDVVAKLRRLLDIKKIGHAGTLDPLATGLLIVCCGRATKQIEQFQDLEKEYIAEIKFGATTKTDDAEADEENIKDITYLTPELIVKKAQKFIGEISQIPPLYSAKKIDGKRLYDIARKNKNVELKPNIVKIFSLDFLNFSLPIVKLKVVCSKGTYIRALARDLGAELGCGGYLWSLRRTRIGQYKVENALKIHELVNKLNSGQI